MSHPLIGITTQRETYNGRQIGGIGQTYQKAVARAGGIPLMLPVTLQEEDLQKLFSRLQGLLLTGGPDISPMRYGGTMHPNVKGIDTLRDESDILLAKTACELKLPLLGICRGFQTINVAFDGTLYTELYGQHPNAIYHTCFKPDLPLDLLTHSIRLVEGGRLAEIVKATEIRVNSLHHQGVKRLGAGLNAVAFAPDELVEGIEIPDHPFGIGVQWHPELLPNVPHSQALFSAFIHAARTVG